MTQRNEGAFRRWWWILPITVAIALVGAFVGTKAAEPQYKAACRLFVAVSASTTPAETYQGSLMAQERVVAYLDLIKSERVAAGTIDALNLDMNPRDLMSRIDAQAEPKSVLMNVSVMDSSAQGAADLANGVCNQFRTVAREAEAPTDSSDPQINVKQVEQASAPERPVSPSLKRNLAVGGVVGLLVGASLILILDRIRPRAESASKAVGREPT